MSDTLRAPVIEQRSLRAVYSSSESRTLIIRERGFRTVMSYSEVAGDLGAACLLRIAGETEDTRLNQCLLLHPHRATWSSDANFRPGFAPVTPIATGGLEADSSAIECRIGGYSFVVDRSNLGQISTQQATKQWKSNTFALLLFRVAGKPLTIGEVEKYVEWRGIGAKQFAF
jgi:hypothetical protein